MNVVNKKQIIHIVAAAWLNTLEYTKNHSVANNNNQSPTNWPWNRANLNPTSKSDASLLQ